MAVINKEKYVNQGEVIAQQGDDAWKTGKYDEARTFYGQAAKFFHDNEDNQGQAIVLSRLGELELSLENFEAAQKTLNAAIELVKNEPDAESILADAYIKKAKVFIALYELDSALKEAKKAQDILKIGGSNALLGDAYDQGAYIFLLKGDDKAALKSYQKAANVFNQEGYGLKEASVLRAMARIAMKLKIYDKAHDWLETSRALYRENGDILGEASALSAIGSLRFIIGDIPNARKALMKSVFLYGKAEHHFAEAEALLYLARVEASNAETGDFARAKSHYKKSIELYDFLQNDMMKIAVLEEYNNFLKREIID